MGTLDELNPIDDSGFKSGKKKYDTTNTIDKRPPEKKTATETHFILTRKYSKIFSCIKNLKLITLIHTKIHP